MAKVYDALQRAERERKRAAGEAMPPVAPRDVPAAAPKARARSASEKRSLAERFRQRLGRREAANTAAEVNKRRISMLQPDSYVAEQFRALRGRIDALAAQHPIRTLVVASSMAGEGKTTASINLACVTAMSVGRRVLLVDCDMRKPKVHQALGLRPAAGLAEVLAGNVSIDDAIIKVDGMNLDVLAVRSRPSNPSELLGSPRMREFIEEVAARYDRVILDTPAALGVPDAKAVVELADGLVIVVRADVTSQHDLEATLEILDRRRLLGLVLNGAHVDHGRYGYAN
jgi:capsular exopolysaccharide synthesis family protein